MKKKLAWGVLAVLIVFCTAGGVFLLWPKSKINQESFLQIQKGMTRHEVERILGGPSRCEDGYSVTWVGQTGMPMVEEDIWCGEKGAIIIVFDADRVSYTRISEKPAPLDQPRTFVEKVRSYLPW